METKLARISQMSSENPDMVFTSIGHLINKERLTICNEKMEGKNVVGIDGVSRAEYEKKQEGNREELVLWMKKKSYKPKAARKGERPKESGNTRPLSIYCDEDKLVQEALKELLEAVFEPHFYEEMMGFRPGRSCHQAIKKLNGMLEREKTNYVLDADIKSFFQHLDHDWIVRFIESKIKDPNITRLVRRILKSGILEDYQYHETVEGSCQGSECSPVLANLYMHYVLVWWFVEKVKPGMKVYCGLVVYADDFVVCFQDNEEAEEFYERLKRRLLHFGLSLEEDKSRLIEFGRYAKERSQKEGKKAGTFDFLGFTHYCSENRNGKFRVKRKTSKKKLAKKSREMNAYMKRKRHEDPKELIKKLNEILIGYYHYYGITDNSRSIWCFYDRVKRRLYYWLNRRSQRNSYTWEGYRELLKQYPLKRPKIYVNVYA
ncbi:group II intron reverse transcriptase/maturase [Clostridium transplantifaecale]|uniref:group II intron reverse transcriptase/maturase n=1 Tax=Clostridium transplantifaecale TaxID=2479838 RepID=UPI000F638D05|nr:group II intron reverse transcriptase/maturase [Clostridium transplantifaecale]